MTKKIIMIATAAVLALALVAGATTFFVIRNAQAKGIQLNQELSSVFQVVASRNADETSNLEDLANRRPRPFPEMDRLGGIDEADGTYLAEALGISVEELETAILSAREKGLTQLVESGMITQAQADRIIEFGMGKHEPGLDLKFFGWLVPETSLDYDALLAAELKISVEELESARQQARELAFQAAVESGRMTQEQVDWLKIRQALQPYLDQDALMSRAFGMDVEEFRQGLQDAYKAALQQAVEDGVITQEQADLLLEQGLSGFRMPGIDMHSMPGMDGRWPGGRGSNNSYPTQPESVEPQSDL